MPNNATPFGSQLVGETSQLGDKLSDMATQVKDRVSDFGTAAANKFDANREAAAAGMKDAASSMHENAGSVSGGDRLTNMAHSAASALDTTADWVRDNNSTKIMADVTNLVKRNPGPSMLAAIAVGFLIGRALSSKTYNNG
jgi:ElaB/YqjD/DUF883 family membrane-anchored ribosome-binding protein